MTTNLDQLRSRVVAVAPLLPLFYAQGLWVFTRIPKLAAAEGTTVGCTAGYGKPLRLLTLGESTIDGVGAAHHGEALTGQLAQALTARLDRPVAWRAVGKMGATARVAIDELLPRVPQEPVDLVFLGIGANDALRMTRLSTWRNDLETLIQKLRKRIGNAQIFLSAVPPLENVAVFPQPLRGALGLRAEMVNAATKQIVAALPWVDLLPMPYRGDLEFLAVDRFHPSPAGYREWADFLAGEIAPVLDRSPNMTNQRDVVLF